MASLTRIIIVFLVLTFPSAWAHELPEHASITIQTESQRAGILIQWTSDASPQTRSLLALRRWSAHLLGKGDQAKLSVIMLAMRGIEITLNGNPIDLSHFETKYFESKSRDRLARNRVSAFVMIAVDTAPGDVLQVRIRRGGRISSRWLAKSPGVKCVGCAQTRGSTSGASEQRFLWAP